MAHKIFVPDTFDSLEEVQEKRHRKSMPKYIDEYCHRFSIHNNKATIDPEYWVTVTKLRRNLIPELVEKDDILSLAAFLEDCVRQKEMSIQKARLAMIAQYPRTNCSVSTADAPKSWNEEIGKFCVSLRNDMSVLDLIIPFDSHDWEYPFVPNPYKDEVKRAQKDARHSRIIDDSF